MEDEKINIEDLKPDKTKRILTGERPTGHLHIGHYFGSLGSWVKLQDDFDKYILTNLLSFILILLLSILKAYVSFGLVTFSYNSPLSSPGFN